MYECFLSVISILTRGVAKVALYNFMAVRAEDKNLSNLRAFKGNVNVFRYFLMSNEHKNQAESEVSQVSFAEIPLNLVGNKYFSL